MKKFITIVLVMIFLQVQSQNILENSADIIAKNVEKILKKQLPKESKVAVLMFMHNKEFQKNEKTIFGIELADHLATRLRVNVQKKLKRYNYDFINLASQKDKFLNEVMRKYFDRPKSEKEEEEMLRKLNIKQRPDYFLTGSYKIENNQILFQSIKLKKNKFANSKGKETIGIENCAVNIETNSDRKKITELNINIRIIEHTYEELMDFEGKASFFTASILKGDENMNQLGQNESLEAGEDYVLKLKIKEKSYVYAFYYESRDPEKNFLYMLHPYSQQHPKLFSTGSLFFPLDATFSPSKEQHSNKIAIRVIATKKEIPITFTQTNDGFIIFTDKNCEDFLKKLNNLELDEISTSSIMKKVR